MAGNFYNVVFSDAFQIAVLLLVRFLETPCGEILSREKKNNEFLTLTLAEIES